MDQYPEISRVIDAIEGAGIAYMLVGSLSTNIYGVMRNTKDADIVLELEGHRISEIMARLDSTFRLDPQTRFETVTGTVRSIIDVGDTGFQVELFRLSRDPHDQERFRRRVNLYSRQLGRNAFVATPEDAIIMKLRWAQHAARGKDRDDVRDVIAVQDEHLDWAYIYRWTDEHGTTELLNEIRASIPPI